MNRTVQKVKDNPGLVRDTISKGILTTDSEYLKHLSKKRQREEQRVQKEKINNLEFEINQVKSDISEIKGLLLQILQNDHSTGK